MSPRPDTDFLLNWILKKREEGNLDNEILDFIEKNVKGDGINKEGLIADLLGYFEKSEAE